MSGLLIAAGQFAPGTDKNRNLATIAQFAHDAAAAGARLLVLPEYSSYFDIEFTAGFVSSAEPLTGRFATTLARLAEQHDLCIVAGMNEQIAGEDRFQNTLVAAGPDATILALYRKVHLYDAFGHRESDLERPGDPAQSVVFDVDGLRVGLQTCYDLRFPESTRRLIDAGAELVAIPAQWVPGPFKEEHWATLLAARAIENTAYVLGVGQTAPGGSGRSLLIDPMGVVRAAAGGEPELLLGRADPAVLQRVRSVNPALALRRLHVVPDD